MTQTPTMVEVTAHKGVADGYASLDDEGQVPADQLGNVEAASDALIKSTGGTMLADIILPGTPGEGLGAAPKQYVDAETTRAQAAETVLRTAIAGLGATAWQANTAYPAETIVSHGVGLYQAPTGGVPTRATFTAGDWDHLADIALPVGTTSGTVMAGDDSRVTTLGTAAYEPTSAFDGAGTASGLVATEASTRAAADTSLAGSVTSEATTRSTADGTLASSITAEATARANADALLVPISEVGQPSGVASLDSSGLVPLAEMPAGGAPTTRSGAGAPVITPNDRVGDNYEDTTNFVKYLNLSGTLTVGQPWTTGPASCIVVPYMTSPPVTKPASGTVPSTTPQSIPPLGVITESVPRGQTTSVTLAATASGTLRMTLVYLSKGTVVSKLAFESGSTAAVTPTHWWLGLYDDNLNQLATTADQTTAPIGITGSFDIAITEVNTTPATPTTGAGTAAGSITVPYSGFYYVGLMIVAVTMPTYTGISNTTGALQTLPPALNGNSDTGQTTPPAFPHTATALSGLIGNTWVACL